MTILLTYEKEPGSNEVTGVNKGVTKGKVEVTYTNGKKTSI